MQQITKEYILLFNAITDAEITLQNLLTSLITAQQTAEELYMNTGSIIITNEATTENDCSIYED